MCSSSKDTVATDPMRMFRTLRRKGSTSTSASTRTAPSTNSAYLTPRDGTRIGSHASFPSSSSSSSSSNAKPASASSASSSVPSLASLREFLPESAILYPFAEICSATNNFLARRLSSSSSNSWRCTLRGKDAVAFQRRFLGDPTSLRSRLASTSKFHHSSIARLLGASLGGDHIFLVYEYVNGASLADCLRNPKNRGFTILSTLLSRLEIAVDVAQGLEYIHHYAAIETPTPARSKTDPTRREGPVHNRITSTAIMVTDPELRAKICHFGAAELSGEIPTSSDRHDGTKGNTGDSSPKLRKNASREVRFEGTRGYIAPEVMEGGAVSQKSDVYAFGVLLLELLSGEEPLTYKYNRQTQTYENVSIVVTAREVMGGAGEQEDETRRAVEGGAASGRHWRLRQWMDRRLNDSYPVEVVERAVRLALECVDADAGKRPDMVRVAGKISRLLLGESRAWAEKVRLPTEISVSVGPR